MAAYRNKITYLSFILAVMIIFRHSVNIEVYALESGALFWLETWVRELTDLVVPFFFLQSAYLFYRNFSWPQLKRKWSARFFSLVIPYLIWNAVGYAYFLLISAVPLVRQNMVQSVEPFTVLHFLKNTLTGEYNILWFVRYLIIFTLLGPLIYPVMRKKYGAVMIAVFMVLDRIWGTMHFHYFLYGAIYLAGEWIGCNWPEEITKKRSLAPLGLGYLLVSTIVFLFVPKGVYTALYIPLRISQCAAIWLLADVLAIEAEPPRWMTISFFVYCSHHMILELLEKVFLLLLGRNLIGAWADFLLATPVTLLIILALAWILRRRERLWSILTGNR